MPSPSGWFRILCLIVIYSASFGLVHWSNDYAQAFALTSIVFLTISILLSWVAND